MSEQDSFSTLAGELLSFEPVKPRLFSCGDGLYIAMDKIVSVYIDPQIPESMYVVCNATRYHVEGADAIKRFFDQWEVV